MSNMVYSIGYTGLKPEQLAKLVKDLGAMLVDVRFSPRSRVQHWNKGPLMRLVGAASYLHVPALGNVNYKSDAPLQLADPAAAVALLRPILQKQPIILVCACKDATTCHRTPAATYLADALGADVVHLTPPRAMPNVTRAAVVPEQLSLF